MTMKHRVAIIGLGMAVKPHALALMDLAGAGRVEIAGGFSPSMERRVRFTEAYGLPFAENLEQIIDDKTVDVVLILTPPFQHLDLVRRAAEAGKHILLEKPIEGSTARAVELVAACEAAGVTLGVVFQHRFRAGARALAQAIADGRLGRLLSASASIRWWRGPDYFAQAGRGMKARDGGGVLLTQAIHTLDLFLSLTGPLKRVAAQARTSSLRQIDTEDIVAAALEFENGAIGVLDATTVTYPGFPERIEIAGELASAVLEVEKLELYFHDGKRETHGAATGEGGGGADPMAFNHAYHRDLISDFLDAIEQRRAPLSSGRVALRVHHAIDALLASSEAGSWIAPADAGAR
jgi:predicted dehydrogenase